MKAIRLLIRSLLLMQLSFAIILATSHQLSAKGFSQASKVTLNMQQASVSKVLKAIEKQTAYRFVYSNDFFAGDNIVSVQVKETPLTNVLSSILEKTGFTFKMADEDIIVIMKIPVEVVRAKVHGKVTTTTGEALEGVSVAVSKPAGSTITNAKGEYDIVADNEAVIAFSFIGYERQTIPVDGRSEINISMKKSLSTLSDLVVIGYGAVKKSDLTGAVSSVSSEKITQVNGISNVAQALQGQAAGVQVNQASGQPGEFMRIKIRGTTSIGASSAPLYVVDGLPLDGLTSAFNPNDIAQIEVLKDASATAIYGSRGANGVIMITTKKGKSGKAKVTYDGYYGVQSLRKKLDIVNAVEFATLQNEVAQNGGTPLPWTASQIDSLRGKGTDWQDLVYGSAPVQNHDISISGGNENTKYFTSFGFFDQRGIIENSGFKRLSFRTNLDQKINDRLNFTTSLSLQHSKYELAQFQGAEGGGGVPWGTMVMPPTQNVYNPDGSYTRFTGVTWGETNPVGIARELWRPANTLRIIGNVALNYKIIDGLTLKLTAGIDRSDNKSDYYAPSTITIGRSTDKDGNPISGAASKSYSNSLTFINENTLNYDKKFGDHALNALAGITYQSTRSENLNSGTAYGFISDLYENNNISSAVTLAQPGTGYSDYKLVSFLGRINYGYKGKYVATVTGRYDGSSKFGRDNKFAFFPSAALAWNVAEEEFLKNSRAVSNLKLRVSYGTSGNQAINPYQTLANMANVPIILGNVQYSGFVPGSLENASLKWETTKQFDVGFDLGLLNDRIQLTADYYSKRTSDLLLNVNLPTSSGYSSILQNIGVVRNQGYEFQLATQNITGTFNWSSNLTFTSNRTKVLDLGKDALGKAVLYKEIGAGGNWFPTIVGKSMMQLYGYTVTGIYQTDQEAIDNGEPSKHAGDYKFRNWDGKGIVNDQEDRTTISHLEPKFTFGFNNSFSYKNFDLSLLFVGSYGNDIANEFRKYNITLNGQWAPTKEAFNGRWRGEGTSNSFDKPAINSGRSIGDYANTLWIEDGSYLRLRDITLGYTFSASQLSFAGISSIRLYVSAQNWLTATSYSGYDPEVSWAVPTINGWDRGNYPSTKSFTVGARVNF